MTRIIGPTGSRRRRRFLLVPILCTAAVALFLIAGAQAVHDLGGSQLHGYAVRYNVTGAGGTTDCASGQTCDVIYFGLDRFDNSGDAQNGVWFLQSKCGEGTNKVGGATGFACTDPTPGTDPSDDFHRNG